MIKENIKKEFNLENVLSTIREYPDKQQKDLLELFIKNSTPLPASRLSEFFKQHNIAVSNNILSLEGKNRPVLFYKNDLNLQLNFMKWGKFIRSSIKSISKIMIYNYQYLSQNEKKDKILYTITIHLNNNSIDSFFKYIEYIDNSFKLNIYSNTIGYKCIHLTFHKKNSAIRFKKLLRLLKSSKFMTYTVFECMNECNYKLKR